MTRFLIVGLFLLVVVSGCTGTFKAANDAQRLEQINRFFENGDYDQVLAKTSQYLQEYPNSFEGWSLLGWAYVKTGDLDKAHESFGKSLKINPDWDNAYVGIGVIYRKRGDNRNARRSYLKAISILPENAEAYSSLGIIELLDGNDEMAVEYGEKAWALRKDDPVIPANLAIAYHYLENHSKRDEYFRHAERLDYRNLQTLQDIFDDKVSIR